MKHIILIINYGVDKMNIPDGFIPLWQCAIYIILMFIIWIFTIKWFVERLIIFEKETPSAGRIILYIFLFLFLVAFVFVIQAFNIPVPFGIGVGLLGAATIAIVLRSRGVPSSLYLLC